MSATADPLRGVRVKLDNADRHLLALDAAIGTYLASQPIYLDGHHDAAASKWVVTVRVREEPPAEIGAIVGDVAHNLRSALDQLTWQLALLTTDSVYDRTQFPIVAEQDDYPRVAARQLQSLRPEHVAFVERLQPYHGDDRTADPLYLLNRLSNVDKHRQLHLANTGLYGASIRIGDFQGYAIGGISIEFGLFTDGSTIALIDVYDDQSGREPYMNVGIDGAFDLGAEVDGEELSVFAGLYVAREFVGDVVDWFEPELTAVGVGADQ